MWWRLVARMAAAALKHDLPPRERNLLTGAILSALQAAPLTDIISTSDDGQLLIAGRTLDYEAAVQLREHARSALDNKALAIVRAQVEIVASSHGAVKAETMEGLIFSRAALWWMQQMDKHLKLLAQRHEEPDL